MTITIACNFAKWKLQTLWSSMPFANIFFYDMTDFDHQRGIKTYFLYILSTTSWIVFSNVYKGSKRPSVALVKQLRVFRPNLTKIILYAFLMFWASLLYFNALISLLFHLFFLNLKVKYWIGYKAWSDFPVVSPNDDRQISLWSSICQKHEKIYKGTYIYVSLPTC